MENDCRMKEINARGRVTFQKERKHVETTGTKFNKSSEMETLFVALSLNVRRGPSEEILPVRGFIRVLLVLADLHPDKILLFLWCQECAKSIEILRPK